MPQIPPEQLDNAISEELRELKRSIENFQRPDVLAEVLAIKEAETVAQRASDLRKIQDRYPSSGVIKSDIFRPSPGNYSTPLQFDTNRQNTLAFLRGFDQITGEELPRSPFRQYRSRSAQMDPIRLYFELGDAASNFFRQKQFGVDNEPAPFERVVDPNVGRPEPAPWTYEPEGSVNIIFNPGGLGRNPDRNAPRESRVWRQTNNIPFDENNKFRDTALQWALSINHVDNNLRQPVLALTEPYRAWDKNDPNKGPLRSQFVIRNHLPQILPSPPQGEGTPPGQQGQGIIFNMAQAMIDLAEKTSPEQGVVTTLPEDFIEYLQTVRNGLRGLHQSVQNMLTVAGFEGNDRLFEKQYAFSEVGRVEVEPDREVDFSIQTESPSPVAELRSVNCTIYDVYLACRSIILNDEQNIVNSQGRLLQLNNIVLSAYAYDYNNREVFSDERRRELRRSANDPRYAFRDALNTFVDFEFYDFTSQNPWTRDRFTDMLDKAPGRLQIPPPLNDRNRRTAARPFSNERAGLIIDSIGGYVNPEYNYFNQRYEAASQIMPEPLLPNMYIYELATGNNNDIPLQNQGNRQDFVDFLAREGQNDLQQSVRLNPNENRHEHRAYDKLITLDQFESFTLKALGGADEERRESLTGFLNDYATAVQGSNVTIDYTSRLNNEYYNLTTPPDELDMFDNFYALREFFPMYIDVGVPLYNTLGPIGDSLLSLDDPETNEIDFDLGYTSTGLVNSILTSSFQTIGATIYSAGLVAKNFDTNNMSNMTSDRSRASRAEDFSAKLIRTESENIPLKVYDFDVWADNAASLERNQTSRETLSRISFRGPTQIQMGAFIENQLQDYLETVKQNAEVVCRENMVTYQDLMVTKEKIVAETESLLYKLVKIDFLTGDIIQNYFFPASQSSRMIKFVDTQVKYGKKYLYELYGYDIVYGSTFRFRNRWAKYPPRTEERDIQGNPPYNLYLGQDLSFSFNVETLPNLKIIEYPIYTYRSSLALAFRAGVNNVRDSFAAMEAGDMGGVSYPVAAVYDRPPLPPESSIIPFQGDKNNILFNFSPRLGTLVGKDAVPYVSLQSGDEEKFLEVSDIQRRVENYTLPEGHIEFKTETENELSKVEIFRTTELDMDVSSKDELYRSFENKLYKTLDTSLDPDDPSGNYARSFDFIDNIQPNINYYYTFRMGDLHNNMSNPTEIFRVRIDSQEAGSYYVIEEVVLKERMFTKPSKDMVRYLEVRASDIQSLPYVSAAEGDITTSLKSLVDTDTDNKVENNKFLIRLSSKDTGRKIDIKTSFVVKERKE